MKSFLKSDLFFKIASVVIATILWLYVVQFENPEFYISMSDIPVRVENTSLLAQNNLVLTAQETDSVSLRIKGKRQTVSSLDKSSVYAYIDLKAITGAGDYKLPVKVVFSENNVFVADDSMPKIKVSVEKCINLDYEVRLKTTGNVKSGYYAIPDESSVSTVNVSSPESTAQLVSYAVAELDITDADAMVEKNVPVKLFDSNNNLISNSNIKSNPEKIMFRCNVYPMKNVPVKWEESGELPEGAKGFKVSEKSVNIAGPEELLENIEYLDLGVINLESFTPADDSEVFKIENLLESDNIYIADDFAEIVVTVNFDSQKNTETNDEEPVSEPDDSSVVSTSVTVDNIELLNVPEGYTAKLINPSVSFTVSGNPLVVEYVFPGDFNASVDLSHLAYIDTDKTDYELPVTVLTNKNVTVTDVKNIKVRITRNQ